MTIDAPRMGLPVTRDPFVYMKYVGFHAPRYGRILGVHLDILSRVWMGMDPCRPDCCRDGWGRLG